MTESAQIFLVDVLCLIYDIEWSMREEDLSFARVAELVYAYGSGPYARKSVWVQIPLLAPDLIFGNFTNKFCRAKRGFFSA